MSFIKFDGIDEIGCNLMKFYDLIKLNAFDEIFWILTAFDEICKIY